MVIFYAVKQTNGQTVNMPQEEDERAKIAHIHVDKRQHKVSNVSCKQVICKFYQHTHTHQTESKYIQWWKCEH